MTTRLSVADPPTLDMRRLDRAGQVTPRHAALGVRLDGAPHPIRVDLAWTPCRFGGHRPWLVCPSCRRRRVRLFLNRGCWLDCRSCLGLAYPTTRWGIHDRRLERLHRIHRRMGGTGSLFHAPPRPKGMHRRTYARLREAGAETKAALWGGLLEAEDRRLEPSGRRGNDDGLALDAVRGKPGCPPRSRGLDRSIAGGRV